MRISGLDPEVVSGGGRTESDDRRVRKRSNDWLYLPFFGRQRFVPGVEYKVFWLTETKVAKLTVKISA